MRDHTVVDLFCGAGGLSIGLERAGFRSVALVDANRDCRSTLDASKARGISVEGTPDRRYLEDAQIVVADIADIGAQDLRLPGHDSQWRPTLLAGGPPCQPFSSAGKQQGIADPRGQLFLHFVRLADELQPDFILFENVQGLVTAKTPDGRPGGVLELVQQSFEGIGYACRFALLNAADFGAPQRRVRLFMLGARRLRLPQFPRPTHGRIVSTELLRKPWVGLGEFLASRPDPDPGDVAVPSGKRAEELLALTPGTGLKSGGIVEANRPSGHWGYRQDCFLADPALPARTVRTATSPDWVRDRAGRMRRLTWRECAGLQGFPENWAFAGTLASRFAQIGNAVHSSISEAIGKMVIDADTAVPIAPPTSPPWPPEFRRRVDYTVAEDRVNGAVRAAARAARSG